MRILLFPTKQTMFKLLYCIILGEHYENAEPSIEMPVFFVYDIIIFTTQICHLCWLTQTTP